MIVTFPNMQSYIISCALLIPLFLLFNEEAIILNFAGLAYALALYKLAHTTRGKAFINKMYNYTEFLTDKYLKK